MDPITEYAQNNKDFKYWRTRTLYSMMLGYGSYYFVRQNFAIAIPSICKALNITKTDLGSTISVGAIIYGVSKLLSGLLGDKYSSRYVMTIGLFLSGIMNLCLGASSVLPTVIICYSLNQCVQSMGSPPCSKLLANWFAPKERGSKWGIWDTASHIGSAINMFIAPLLLTYYGWRSVFYIPGIIAICLSFFLFNRLRDTPQSLGFPSIEDLSAKSNSTTGTDISSISMNNTSTSSTTINTLKLVLHNKYVWCLAIANLFVYINRTTFVTWGPTLLQEFRGISIQNTGLNMVIFEIAGMCGSILAGMISDKLFDGRRAPVATLGMLFMGLAISIFWCVPCNSHMLNALCMFCIGLVSTVPCMLISLGAIDFSEKGATASSAGFTGTLGYLGTVIAGFGNGYLSDHCGWNTVVFCTIISAVIASICLSLLWNKKPVK